MYFSLGRIDRNPRTDAGRKRPKTSSWRLGLDHTNTRKEKHAGWKKQENRIEPQLPVSWAPGLFLCATPMKEAYSTREKARGPETRTSRRPGNQRVRLIEREGDQSASLPEQRKALVPETSCTCRRKQTTDQRGTRDHVFRVRTHTHDFSSFADSCSVGVERTQTHGDTDLFRTQTRIAPWLPVQGCLATRFLQPSHLLLRQITSVSTGTFHVSHIEKPK